MGLAFGLLAFSYWLTSLAAGEQSYRTAERAFACPLGVAFLVGWTYAFIYHLLNGMRHLFWDIGLGFERRQRHASGWLAVIGSVVLTACVWALLLRAGR